jgi:cardiolipin synthase
VATIDGSWVSIGSSNFDRRSIVYNNEIDAVILGRSTAADVEDMLRGWMHQAERVTLAEWEQRSWGEWLQERVARLYWRFM